MFYLTKTKNYKPGLGGVVGPPPIGAGAAAVGATVAEAGAGVGAAAAGAAAGASCESLDRALPATSMADKAPTKAIKRGCRLLVFISSLTAFVLIMFILPYKSMLKPISWVILC